MAIQTLPSVGITPGAIETSVLAPFAFRNKIINGGFAVDQRNVGASKTITAAAALSYATDRWYVYCTGANATGQRVAGATQSQYRYQFTGAASVTAIGIGQRIEAVNCYSLNGTTATLSVDLANSLLTSVSWALYYATTTDTFGTLASPTRTSISSGTFTVTSTVTKYSTQITIPSAATTGLELVLSVGAQTSGTWTIGNVQLEAGATASPFEQRDINSELRLCQRYYEKSFKQSSVPAQNIAYNDNAAAWTASKAGAVSGQSPFILFQVTKRAAPSGITFFNPSVANAFTRNVTGSTDATATSVSGSTQGERGFMISCTGTAAWVVGDILSVHWTADTEL